MTWQVGAVEFVSAAVSAVDLFSALFRAKHHALRLVASIAMSLTALASPSYGASADEVFRKVQRQVLAVEIVDGEQLIDYFSGIVLEPGTVAVPCDGISIPNSIRVRVADVSRAAKLAHRDILRNLCLLQVDGLDTHPVAIAKRDSVAAGARVYAISNALGMGIAVSEGVVSAMRTFRKEEVIQFTAPVAPGSDGGGLFNESGQLVGVIRYRKLDGQNVNFAAPAEWLGQIVGRAASQTELGAARDVATGLARGSRWEALAEHARKRLAVARDDVEAWRWLALASEQRNDPKAARDAYREILAREPDDVHATLGSGWAQYALGEYAAALDTARAGIAVRREDARLWLLAAYAEISLKRPDDARKSLETAVLADPWNPRAQAALGVWARDSGDLKTAAAAFRMQARIQPGNIDAWLDLSNAYAGQDRYDRALTAAEKAIKLDATSGEAVLLRGRALVGLGRFTEGIQTLKTGLTLKSKWPALGWYWLASAYRSAHLDAESIASYRETLRIEPKFALARQWLAWTLQETGQFDEALAEIENVAKDHPELPWVWRRRGSIFAGLGQHAKAIPQYERSLDIDPKQPWVWRALADAYRREGRASDARRTYERLLELDRREADLAYRENFLPFEAVPGSAR